MKPLRIVLAVVVVLAILVGLLVYWVFGRDQPDAVSLDDAVESVQAGADDPEENDPEENDANSEGDPGQGDTTGPSDVNGTWVVDTETGTFNFESADGSFVGFRIDEELTVGSVTAVGRTGDVFGSITIDETTLTAASFEVDLTTLGTNDRRRDDEVQETLSANGQTPAASFVLTEPIELGDDPASGQPLAFEGVGDLTINSTTQPATFDLQAQLVDDTIVVVASTTVTFTDYGLVMPSAPIVVSVDEVGVIEAQLLFVRDQ